MLGNLMGDFVRGPQAVAGDDAVSRGIRLHRHIDSFTDSHPVVRRSWQRLQAPYRRYGGILVDVFYDHLLARHWADFGPEPLASYTARAGRVLSGFHDRMPARMQRYVLWMGSHDVLGACREQAGVQRVLYGLSRRLRRPNPLARATGELTRLYPALEEDFLVFYPLLREQVAGWAGLSPSQLGYWDPGIKSAGIR